MKLPEHNVLIRAEWKKLRDKKGGKSGLSKVDLGSALDDFHTAYYNAKKSGKIDPLKNEIKSLTKKVKTYIIDVKENYKDVASLAKTKIQDELLSLETAIDKAIETAENNKAADPEVIAGQMLDLLGKNKNVLDPIFKSIDGAEASLRKIHKLSSSSTLDKKMIPVIIDQVDQLTKKVFENQKLLKKSWDALNKDALHWCQVYVDKCGVSKTQASEKWMNDKTYLELKAGRERCLEHIEWVTDNATKIAGGSKELKEKNPPETK